MNKRTIAAIVLLLLAVNGAVIYHSLHANDAVLGSIPVPAALPPAVNASPNLAHPASAVTQESVTDLAWSMIQQTKVVNSLGTARVDFAPGMPASDNQLVRVSGVLFFLKDGIENNQVKWCVLLPPSRISCCGISCDPHQELMFYIDCSKNPWPKPDGKMLAVVQGRLHLRRDDSSWCLYTLEDALVTPLAGAPK